MSKIQVDQIADRSGNNLIPVSDIASNVDLAASGGSALVGYLPAGTGAVATTVQSKLRESVSVKDFGAVGDGVTDDTVAIQRARTEAAPGRTVEYQCKTYSPDYWASLAPLATEWIHGTPTAYSSDQSPNKPLTWAKNFVAVPMTIAGYAHFASAWDTYTAPGIDIQSGATAVFRMNSYSTNSSGTNFNNTYQTALVANSSALSTTASASVEAINAIVESVYTGALPQMVVGIEVNASAANAPGFFGMPGRAYSVGVSTNWGSNTQDGTVAFGAGTSVADKSWRHGLISAGTTATGITVTRNGALRPTVGAWIASAGTYGIYIGGKQLHEMNPGQGGDYAYVPAIGIALGQTGEVSSLSHKLRFTAATPAGVETHLDAYLAPSGFLSFDANGGNVFGIAANGAVHVAGLQVVSARVTGYTAIAGTQDRATALNTGTVTLAQLASRVAALQQDLSAHGLIG